MSDLKIKNITIQHFRGITKELRVDFHKKNVVCSHLIYGENGSGKSSVIDAIELCLLGSINLKGILSSSVSYENLDVDSEITVELTDGSKKVARLKYETNDYGNRNLVNESTTLIQFGKAPFILRRSDILTFWATEAIQRLKIFLGFDNTSLKSEKSQKQLSLEKIYNTITSKRAENLKSLCTFFQLDNDMVLKVDDFFSEYKKKYNATYFTNFKKYPRNILPLVKECQNLELEIKKVKKEIGACKNNSIDGRRLSPLRKRLREISTNVTNDFFELSSRTDHIEQIFLDIGVQSEISLLITVKLKNGLSLNPQYVFSEANQDLLALLIYLEFTYDSSQFGQSKVLVLDDVFQSIDASFRYRIMVFILEKFMGWQIIMTTHDRLWKEQLQQLFQRKGHVLLLSEMKQWSLAEGPILVNSTNMFDDKLKRDLTSGNVVDICSSAGFLLEYICENLSAILSTSIHRKKGDRYTIGDLWPGIYKECKKTACTDVFKKVEDLLYLRNLVGCHFNEWSMSLSQSEAEDFGKAVLDLYSVVYDSKKAKWIESTNDLTISKEIVEVGNVDLK